MNKLMDKARGPNVQTASGFTPPGIRKQVHSWCTQGLERERLTGNSACEEPGVKEDGKLRGQVDTPPERKSSF